MSKSARDVIAEWYGGEMRYVYADAILERLSEAGYYIVPGKPKKSTSDAPSEPESQ